jgi:Spy/CpxP family protein refolding chaperone
VAAASPASAAGTRAPVAQTAHGPIKFLGEALADVPLTEAQRGQIEKLASDAEARHEPALAARRDLLLLLASQVEAGTLDRAALQPKVDAIVTIARSAQPGDRAAFEQLHAILAPDQRVAFADAVEARAGRAKDAFAGRHGLEKWADVLKLTDAQRDQIRGVLRQSFEASGGWREAHGGHDHDGGWGGGHRGAKVFEAFKQDRFVLDEVVPPQDIGERSQAVMGRFLTLAGQVLPILTPEQRAGAATLLRARASLPDAPETQVP